MQKDTLTKTSNPKAFAAIVVKGMQEKKGVEIVSLNLQNIDGADVSYMVICHATSNTHADGVARSVEETVYNESGETPWHSEGRENKEWILLDYVDVVVHIFLKSKREFYNLEELWGDAERTTYPSE